MSIRNRNVPGQLSVAQAVSSANAFQAEAGPSKSGATNPNSFKAPAHKHAHHLHSIPPREKSTRTLIVDHMLWVHGRTRFAQARAELGMTDRTGGPTSSNYTHRRRPENYEEEEEAGSDGEDVSVLKAQRESSDDEEARLHAQDLQLARSLRLRAEGLEKVINSMLIQPPPVHLHFEDDFFVDPNQHILPNGVRLRLALGTLINDFFTRQAPPPPFRHKKYAASISANSPMTTHTSDSSTVAAGLLPPALNVLVPISAYGERKATKRTIRRAQKDQTSTSPSYSSFAISHTQTMTHIPSNSNQPPSLLSKISARVRTLYLEGTDPETANSPPAFRCPRHLHTGCEICVEAKEMFSVKGAGAKGKARERAASIPGVSVVNTPTPGSTFAAPSWPSTSSTVLGTSSNPKVTPIGIAPDGGGISGYQDPSSAGGCSVGVGEGLLKPSINGSVLRRRTLAPYTQRSLRGGADTEADSTGTGYTKLSELLPRFLRLSALVSTELGREVKEGREGKDLDELKTSTGGTTTKQGVGGGRVSPESYTLPPSREWYHLLAGLLTRAALQGYLTAGWRGVNAVECLLGVGLGIDLQHGARHVGAQRTTSPAEGNADDANAETGIDSQRETSPSSSADEQEAEAEPDVVAEDEDLFREFHPDELPSLQQAVAILFPSLGVHWDLSAEENVEEGDESGVGDRQSRQRRKQPNAAEAEFANEMNVRLRHFMEIPDSTPDLSTHMEDLAWQYPAEPVERAATRFLEAIAGWRGKPELEGYKKKPPRTWPSTSSPTGRTASSTASTTPMPLESLVHSNPTTPTMVHPMPPQAPPQPLSTKKPSIDLYFLYSEPPTNSPIIPNSANANDNNSVSPSGGSILNSMNTATHRNLSMDIPHITTSPTSQSRSIPIPTLGPRRQSFSNPAAGTSSYSTSLSHPQPNPRANSFPQSPLASAPFQVPRSSQSPRSSSSVSAPGVAHNHISSSAPAPPPAQYPFYSQSGRPSHSSQSSGTSPTQQRPMSSNSPVGQQIPVWNPATGAWMPAAPPPPLSQGMNEEMGSAADVTGNKRARSPERHQGMGIGPNAKRPR
ncbi:hypothetical protein GYMLUDRAFT_69866 [Collybiopsis luxurians FD-317 M1]|nr:hypothetical protein GYMLUDRAFT_69866 [Collybiopsis luxurians FD-317 M1]